MKTYTPEELKKILQLHDRWLRGLETGKQANLSYANLSNANLSYANLSYADLSYANLSNADLFNANLSNADLSKANLSYANLSYANLSKANLSKADLSKANLFYANLSYAKGIKPEICTPLLLLHDQPGKIRAYKLVDSDGHSPFAAANGYSPIFYEIGTAYSVKDANTDPTEQCAAGISLATLDWCLKNYREGYRVLIAEFEAKDIAVIPTATDGKFRVRKCKIVGEKDISELVK